MLTACEGRTEIEYFSHLGVQWRINFVPIARACGLTPLKLVKEAYAEAARRKDYDLTICVFDRDQHACFNDATAFAASHQNVRGRPFVAFTSTPCFEYWILLHFVATTTPFSNFEEVFERLQVHLPDYKKARSGLYNSLADKLEEARRNARNCREAVEKTGASQPLTRIDDLLELLEKFKQ